MDWSLPGSSVHGIFQARVLEWVAISFSRGSSQPKDRTRVSCIAGRHYPLRHQGKPCKWYGSSQWCRKTSWSRPQPPDFPGDPVVKNLHSHCRGIPGQGSKDATCTCVCVSRLSHVRLCASPWTVALQAPLSTGILQARMLEWVGISSSRGSSPPSSRTQVSRIAGRFFTIWAT